MAFYDPTSGNTPDAPAQSLAQLQKQAATLQASINQQIADLQPKVSAAYQTADPVGFAQQALNAASPGSAAYTTALRNLNAAKDQQAQANAEKPIIDPAGQARGDQLQWNPATKQYQIIKGVNIVQGPGGGGGGGGGQPLVTTTTAPIVTPGGGGNPSALQIITDALTGAGLGSLAANAWTMWNKGYDINAIMDDPTNGIRASAAYKTVFPAMAKLNSMGEGITEGEYLAKVKADKEILKQFNVPSGIFDTPDYLGSLMLNHVNTVDLTNRLQAAQDSVLSLDPSILKYGKDSYGLDTGNLIAWALDPTKATPIIVQQAKAMQIGGAALQSGFAGGMGTNGELLASQAEALANQGVTQAQALQGFVQLGQMGQYGQMLPGDVSGALTGQQMVNAEFNSNANDVMALNKVKATRVNEFNAGGALAASASGVGGIGAANLQA